jgi:hypothetical protein
MAGPGPRPVSRASSARLVSPVKSEPNHCRKESYAYVRTSKGELAETQSEKQEELSRRHYSDGAKAHATKRP